MKKYSGHLADLLRNLDIPAIERVAKILETAREKRVTVFVVGNGGSAATANHFANDLQWGTRGEKTPPMRALSLAANTSALSALGNDAGYENVFTEQMYNLFRPGDILIAISASGNSPNVLKAIDYANDHDGVSLGLVGFDGGKMKKICHQSVHVETAPGEYCLVEDVHMAVCHMLTTSLKRTA